ncbi:alpha-amylase family glycosyl hydrolase [Butyrivibrio sp. VCB2006]|uniref:alpha-amylase family glycosyl hydrolase n=1 Tax=Butyrivibrio sp. VCB2006 TaxID=1280679 RepID=UPI0012DFBBF1|nr:alpha-amylase family glycosyl hydrolase [Butyrivibrio sp. VCB2006]
MSSTNPAMGEKVKISMRVLEDAPIEKVFIRRIVNGAEQYIEMEKDRSFAGLSYYSAETVMNEPRLSYYFVITSADVIYFYTQAGVTTYIPDDGHNFVLLSRGYDESEENCHQYYIQPDWVKGAVYYQIFPTSFKDHSLYGVIEKIPYLKELGVTAVYLNPIFRAPSEHKYDCSDYFHVDESLGGDEALEALSKALHENGLKLILDISINHTGLEYSWAKNRKDLYVKDEDGTLKGWAGYKGLPVLDYRKEEVRDIIYRNDDSVIRKWLRPPYDIDGWRFDVADVWGRNDDVQLADELWKELCQVIKEEKKDAMIIGEHWGDCTDYLKGDLWNAPMNYFGFGRIVRQFAGLSDLFLERVEDFKKIKYKMTAQDVVKRTDEFYTKLPQAIADCNMNLFDSHDVSRAHNNPEIDEAKWQSIVIMQYLWTGIPCIYYGDELEIDGYIEHDSGFRYKMPWEEEAERRKGKKFLTYQKLNWLRSNEPAFSEGGRKVLLSEGRVLAVSRFLDDNIYIGIVSMEDEERKVRIPVGYVGAIEPDNCVDELGSSFTGKMTDDGMLEIIVPAKSSYLIKMNDNRRYMT